MVEDGVSPTVPVPVPLCDGESPAESVVVDELVGEELRLDEVEGV